MNKQLQVIFGTGPLGQAVMRELLTRDNVTIRMVNRSGNRGAIPAQVEILASDAYDAEKVKQVTAGASVVYQCAQPKYTEWREKFPPLQRAILEGTAANDAKLIIGDNLYMYGATDGQPIHENLPYAAKGHKGRTRAAMAKEILDAHKSGKIRAALARGSDFYGEGVRYSAMGERVFDALLQGKAAQFIGNVDLPHTYTYIGDFGKAMVILGENDEALGKAWHVPNAPTMTTRQMIEIIAAEIGVKAKISAMPKIMFAALSLVHPMLRELREMMYEFEEDYILDHSQFEATFGNIATPMDEAIRLTVAWYREEAAVMA
jgi:nucleoside-diphosphate-sugar epimerase